MSKHLSVTQRIEHVRRQLGLSKVRFSDSLGIKPQTYNNFTGKQQSKPNLDLVMGIVSRFHVNPSWLLFGSGPIYEKNNGAGVVSRSDDSAALNLAEFEFKSNPNSNSFGAVNEQNSNQLAWARELVSLQLDLLRLAELCARVSKRIVNAIGTLESPLFTQQAEKPDTATTSGGDKSVEA